MVIRHACRSVDWIASLPVRDLAARDSNLFLWTTNAFLAEGVEVLKAWGFRYITVLTWCKPAMGVGKAFRNNTEHCLFGRRGNIPWHGPHTVGTWFIWPRGAHSAKPEAFQDLIEQVSPPPYLELFARRQRLGWDVWGNEVASTVELEMPA